MEATGQIANVMAVTGDIVLHMSKEMVAAGREKELDQLDDFEAYEWVDLDDFDKPEVFGCTWADRPKAGECKSRICVQDFAYEKSDDFHAATPLALAGRMVEYTAARNIWGTLTADVTGAFLHTAANDARAGQGRVVVGQGGG